MSLLSHSALSHSTSALLYSGVTALAFAAASATIFNQAERTQARNQDNCQALAKGNKDADLMQTVGCLNPYGISFHIR